MNNSASTNVTCLHLSKQDFKFSSAHFLIFDAENAERLHGHNYRVRLKLVADAEFDGGDSGFLIDFGEIKKIVRARLAVWDEHLLLPAENPFLKITEKDSELEVRYSDRKYVFPRREVILLPIPNTSVEWLSRLLAEEWFALFVDQGVKSLSVSVEETLGQAGSYTIQK